MNSNFLSDVPARVVHLDAFGWLNLDIEADVGSEAACAVWVKETPEQSRRMLLQSKRGFCAYTFSKLCPTNPVLRLDKVQKSLREPSCRYCNMAFSIRQGHRIQ